MTEGRELFVLTLHDGAKIVGIAPWYISKTRYGLLNLSKINGLGTPEAGSDYLDVISLKGEEKAVATSIYEFLMNEALSL